MKTLPDSFYKNISTLPIYEHLSEISEKLKSSPSHFLILTAETAAGKSTAVAPYLLEQFDGKIFMLEPRRLAVLSIANRISELLEEECGLTCGYRIQLENKISKNTRLEIMTEGILTRRLQEDPLLESVNLVILDEFHERSIHSDLALAFLKEAVEIRDDLFVIIMSATMDTKALAQYLGDEKCPILNIKGRKFPVEIEYRKENLCSAVIQETKKLENGKAILVFLPGISEINRTCQELQEFLNEENIQILRLHSSLSLKEQKAVLSPLPPDKKRIVLSSSIAETSLTVPGIYTVIDSGLTRLNRMNVRLGMEELVTQAESIFSAEQRAGRAGRLGNGRCIRLWNKNEIRPLTSTPEILRTDLSSLVLECGLRNIFSPNDIHWLTKPADSAWQGALLLLELLGCISENPDSPNQTSGNNASQNLQELQEYKPQSKNFSVTPKGKALAKLGLHPRLGSVAICGAFETVLKYSSYAKSSSDIQQKFLNNLKSRISQINPSLLSESQKLSTNSALLEGFPDRIARLTSNEGVYQFPSGRAASFSKNLTQKINTYPEWIIAPEVDAGETKGIIYSWEKLESSQIQKWLESRSQTKIELSFEKGKIQKNRITSFGKIVLQKTKLP
ncbi:MAG: DEAD/DEAH box helicase, partial [Treponema sp.]|nr:DEAD/DEAH box helicase [Treponema sp.]